MSRALARVSTVLVLALAILCPRAADAQVGSALAASAARPGVIDLFYTAAPGTRVAFFEHVGDAYEPLGTRTAGPGPIAFFDATTWRCDRLVRRFFAIAVAPDGSVTTGTFDVRTGSCRHRFTIAAPRRVTVGAKVHIRVIDSWGIGGTTPQLCIDPPRAKRSCRLLRFPKAVTIESRNVRVSKPGDLRISLGIGGSRIRTSVTIGEHGRPGPAPPPTLLATGDSTMQSIDSFLADGLADKANVVSDVLPGSGISKNATYWLHQAASDVARLHPLTTVISIGANDFFPMQAPDGTTLPCCAEPWVTEYTRRVRAMMRTYIQGGRGRVLWLTLPLARDPRRAIVNAQVNRAIRIAAQGLDHAFVVGLDEFFTPHGYTEVIRWRGQTVHVREPDGIHLNVQGASIAAELIEAALANLG